jgi:hypothetical protein
MLSRSCPDNPVLSTMTANKPLSLAATAALGGTACPQVDAEVCARTHPGSVRARIGSGLVCGGFEERVRAGHTPPR